LFTKEEDLIATFCSFLMGNSEPWGELLWTREFYFGRGRSDIIGLAPDGDIFAFEAKLTDWSKVINQAHRNTCFANYSVIVLPSRIEDSLARYESAILKRGLGVCFVSETSMSIPIFPRRFSPIQPILTGVARTYVEASQ